LYAILRRDRIGERTLEVARGAGGVAPGDPRGQPDREAHRQRTGHAAPRCAPEFAANCAATTCIDRASYTKSMTVLACASMPTIRELVRQVAEASASDVCRLHAAHLNPTFLEA